MKVDKKLILATVPYVVIFIIALQVVPEITALFPEPLPIPDWLIALTTSIIIRIVVYVKSKNAKKYRKGCEYGSARWADWRN